MSWKKCKIPFIKVACLSCILQLSGHLLQPPSLFRSTFLMSFYKSLANSFGGRIVLLKICSCFSPDLISFLLCLWDLFYFLERLRGFLISFHGRLKCVLYCLIHTQMKKPFDVNDCLQSSSLELNSSINSSIKTYHPQKACM